MGQQTSKPKRSSVLQEVTLDAPQARRPVSWVPALNYNVLHQNTETFLQLASQAGIDQDFRNVFVTIVDFVATTEMQISLCVGEVVSLENVAGEWCEVEVISCRREPNVFSAKHRGWVPRHVIARWRKFDEQLWLRTNVNMHDAEMLLAQATDGCFLVRASQTDSTQYTLSLRHASKVYHYRVCASSSAKVSVVPGREFSSLQELVQYHAYRADGLACRLVLPIGEPQRKRASCDGSSFRPLGSPFRNSRRSLKGRCPPSLDQAASKASHFMYESGRHAPRKALARQTSAPAVLQASSPSPFPKPTLAQPLTPCPEEVSSGCKQVLQLLRKRDQAARTQLAVLIHTAEESTGKLAPHSRYRAREILSAVRFTVETYASSETSIGSITSKEDGLIDELTLLLEQLFQVFSVDN